METTLVVGLFAVLHAYHTWSSSRRERLLIQHIDKLENKILALSSGRALGNYSAAQVLEGDSRVLRRDDETEAQIAYNSGLSKMFEEI